MLWGHKVECVHCPGLRLRLRPGQWTQSTLWPHIIVWRLFGDKHQNLLRLSHQVTNKHQNLMRLSLLVTNKHHILKRLSVELQHPKKPYLTQRMFRLLLCVLNSSEVACQMVSTLVVGLSLYSFTYFPLSNICLMRFWCLSRKRCRTMLSKLDCNRCSG